MYVFIRSILLLLDQNIVIFSPIGVAPFWTAIDRTATTAVREVLQ